MSDLFKNMTSWVTTSGVKVLGILIALVILFQISKWIAKWLEKWIPEKDPLQAAEAKKRKWGESYGEGLRSDLMKREFRSLSPIESSFGENRRKNTILNDHWSLIIVN